jgi:transposase
MRLLQSKLGRLYSIGIGVVKNDLLAHSGLAPIVTLANTLKSWQEEIACMWRFTKNNGITEGFHRKMKLIQRRAYGFRNFNNYRLRVIAQCG